MNPRYRRLLIPGLLAVLIAVVVIAALIDQTSERETPADDQAAAAEPATVVSTITDPRITESSGLVLSVAYDDLAYTVNDSGNRGIVFAIKVSTGEVVGTTVFSESAYDVEALSIDAGGTLWVADTGDNLRTRSSVTLYSLEEPGATTGVADVQEFALTYPDGPADVETLLINPQSDAKFLISKSLGGGTVYAIPATLSATADNEVREVDPEIAALITDGAFTPDGKYAVLRDYSTIRRYDPTTWEQLSVAELPDQRQGESLAMEPGGESILIGSEGADSKLLRIPLGR